MNVHNYLATEKLPKELEVKKKQVANLEKVANVPALTAQDLDKIKKKVGRQPGMGINRSAELETLI